MMRKMMGVLAVLALALVLSGGVAMAKFVACPGGPCDGTEFSDSISGLNSTSVRDIIEGRGDRDEIATNAGDDYAHGGSGDDALHGQQGNDALLGGFGKDFLDGGPGRDTLQGGVGSDSINAVEPTGFAPVRDVVDCGEDREGTDVDTAFVDRLDTVKNCEKVFFAK